MNPANRMLLSAISLVLLPLYGNAQPTGTARPEFTAASVKPGPNGEQIIQATPGLLRIEHATLRFLITMAYGVRPGMISGGPGWLDSELFAIQGKADGPAKTETLLLMLQALLEERFQLKVHRETREGSVYELTIAKGGPRLKPPTCVQAGANPTVELYPPGETTIRYCRMNTFRNGPGWTFDAGRIEMSNAGGSAPWQSFTGYLSDQLDRTVVDRTGLAGSFDVHLEWTGNPAASSPSSDAVGPSILTAIQEQLGLKLQSAKGPVEFLVIDHAEKPSAN